MNEAHEDRKELGEKRNNRVTTPRRSSSPRRKCLDSQAQDFGLLDHPYNNHPLIEQVRSLLKSRGHVGFSELQRALKDFDAHGKLALTREAFGEALSANDIDINTIEIDTLCSLFLIEGRGLMDYEDFLRALRGPLDNERRFWVKAAYDSFDKYEDDSVDVEEVIRRYDPSGDPEVTSGIKKQNHAFRNFLRSFDIDEHNEEGHVTLTDFENYYRNVSATMSNTKSFEDMIRSVWHLNSEGECNENYINPEYKPRVNNGNRSNKSISNGHVSGSSRRNVASRPVASKNMSSTASPRQIRQRQQQQQQLQQQYQNQYQEGRYVYQQPQSIPIDNFSWEEPTGNNALNSLYNSITHSATTTTARTMGAGEKTFQFANLPGYPGYTRDYHGGSYVPNRPRTPSTPYCERGDDRNAARNSDDSNVVMDFGNMFETRPVTPVVDSTRPNSLTNPAALGDGGSSRLQASFNYQNHNHNHNRDNDALSQQQQYVAMRDKPQQNTTASNYFDNLSRQQDPSMYLGDTSAERGLINAHNGLMGEQYYQPVSAVNVTSRDNSDIYTEGVDSNRINFPSVNNYGRNSGPQKQERRCRSPKEAFERGQYWKGQARPGSACVGKWKSHFLRDDDPNRIDPQQNAANAMKVMAGGGQHSTLQPKDKAVKNKEISKGLRENIIPLPDPYWG